MKILKKYSTRTKIAASVILVLLLCLFNYMSAAESDSFLMAINPASTIMGMLFVLTYFGLNIVLAVVVLLVLLAMLWLLLLRIVHAIGKIIKTKL